MTTKALPAAVTIEVATQEFLDQRREGLSGAEYAMYKSVVVIFTGCVDRRAPSKFDKEERAFWHQFLIPGRGYRCRVSSLFGPEKMPGEVKYFFRNFIGRDVYVGDDFIERAPGILSELFAWMVQRAYLPEQLDIPKLFPKKIPKLADRVEWIEDYSVPATPRRKTRTLLH